MENEWLNNNKKICYIYYISIYVYINIFYMYVFGGKIYIKLITLTIFKCTVAFDTFTFLWHHHPHPSSQLSHLSKLKPYLLPNSHVQLLVTPWNAAGQASLSFTVSRSLLRLMSFELVMPSNHPILCHPFFSCPQSFPISESFPMSQLFASSGQSIGVSALASVLPMNTQD